MKALMKLLDNDMQISCFKSILYNLIGTGKPNEALHLYEMIKNNKSNRRYGENIPLIFNALHLIVKFFLNFNI